QREVGLSAGEPPATRGYPPSVFSLLPRLLERAGAGERGSITGLYTVLVEGDDLNEPVADTTRSILDGHIVLSRRLATSGHFPSIEILDSVSRVEPAIVSPEHRALARELRRLMATYRDAKDLVEIGAYARGADPVLDRAIELKDLIDGFLRQDVSTTVAPAEAWRWLASLLAPPVPGPVTGAEAPPTDDPATASPQIVPAGELPEGPGAAVLPGPVDPVPAGPVDAVPAVR
ncbi:MAG TPA: hypothetical protein VGG23_06675, partial [Acidimicrobiales bacterium]